MEISFRIVRIVVFFILLSRAFTVFGKSGKFVNSFMDDMLNTNWDPFEDNDPAPVVTKVTLPYSGQSIRLDVANTFINSGYVQIFRNSQWVYICNSKWEMEEATVACKELGFTGGSISNTLRSDNSLKRIPSQSSHPTITIDCSGTETSLNDCKISTIKSCQNLDFATVTCHFNEGCPEGWLSGFDKCYKFYSKTNAVHLAASICARENASLVTIDSVAENNYISTVIKHKFPYIRHFFTGGTNSDNGWEWNTYTITAGLGRSGNNRKKINSNIGFITDTLPIHQTKWFPGWPSHNRKNAEPAKNNGYDCLILTDEFLDPYNKLRIVDYYYWKAGKCTHNAGIYVICQMSAKKPEVVSESCDGKFQCGDKKCVELAAKCDGKDDCSDQSDELDCESCDGKFQCGDKKCVELDTKCDGKDDCSDHSDELDCESCDGKFQCGDKKCVELVAKCDGEDDCSDQSDELDCESCDGKFQCGDKKCVEIAAKCDGKEDCSDHSDELDCHLLVKLVGDEHHSGTVEITYHGNKGVICDHKWSQESAAVICRMMGFRGEASATTMNFFNYSTDNVKFITNDVTCDGNENSLVDCQQNSLSIHECQPNEIAGVICKSSNESCDGKFQCGDKKCVELVAKCDGEDDCSDQSDELDCESCDGKFQCGDKKCVEIAAKCDGKEDCSDHSDELDCHLLVKLVGDEHHSGTVEITYHGNKGVICDHKWSQESAAVICRMMGFRGEASATTMNFFNYSTDNVKFITNDVTCDGNENSLVDCQQNSLSIHECQPNEIAGVICKSSNESCDGKFQCGDKKCVELPAKCDGKDDCSDQSDELDCGVKYQLVNGSKPWNGRVEVIKDGVRGTVCSDKWDNNDATVLCRSLGFINGGNVVVKGQFGSGKGQIWLDDVNCNGNELSLDKCTHGGWGKHNCVHDKDAGVQCNNAVLPEVTKKPNLTPAPTDSIRSQLAALASGNELIMQIKLTGGKDVREGNIEVIISNLRFQVCDDNWDNDDASVVCKMLGFGNKGTATHKSFFKSEKIRIIFNNVACTGTEIDITLCPAVVGIDTRNCSNNLAGVKCSITGQVQSENVKIETRYNFENAVCGRRPIDNNLNLIRSRNTILHITYNKSKKSQNYGMDNRTYNTIYKKQKIIGGEFSTHGLHPWQVRVHRVVDTTFNGSPYKFHICGAVIISEFWLISAAHCFIGKDVAELRMTVGDFSIEVKDIDEVEFEVAQIISHENYDDDTKDYDIALIRIKPHRDGSGIKFSTYVQPICLPASTKLPKEDTMCFISGWGKTKSEGKGHPMVLKAVKVPIISQKMCKHLHTQKVEGFVSERMFCAGYIKGGVDSCDGDSGDHWFAILKVFIH